MNNHTDLLNYLIKTFDLKNYLEIGVQNPENNFYKIKCNDKTGVDPNIEEALGIGYYLCNVDSDSFFKNTLKYREEISFLDLIFIDGLHHADQVKRDFENSLQCLTENGFIVIHDTLPEKEETTHVPRDSKVWHGNVYQFAMTLGCYNKINFLTVDMDCGCTVVYRDEKKQGSKTCLSATWENYIAYRNELLRIVSVPLFEKGLSLYREIEKIVS